MSLWFGLRAAGWRDLPRVPIAVHSDEVALLPHLSAQPSQGHKKLFLVGLWEHQPELVPYVSTGSSRM